MPGIFGAVSLSAGRVDTLPFDRIVPILCHRPTMHTARVDAPGGDAVLGVVDLGVLSGSGATYRAADGSLVVVHGDILDPEPAGELPLALLERYRQDPTSLRRLEGSFAVAIWDAPHARLILVNDRFGLRNVYYTRTADV